MKSRTLHILLMAGVLSVAILAALSTSAGAEQRTITVRLITGQIVTVTVDVPPGTPLDQIKLPGEPVAPGTPQQPPEETSPPTTTAPPPTSRGGGQQPTTHGKKKVRRKKKKDNADTGGTVAPEETARPKRRRRTPLRNPDGSPTASNPGFMDALPGPSTATGVPNFVIRKFRVPVFLLPIYQAAGIQYGIRWEILAAINEIETDYGRNLNVSSAGALGWMQFIPSSWRAYGVDANKDGKKDPYNPVDAIFAYNHADGYVDSERRRARLIAGVPADLVGSLTGLTEGRFPVHARARYADDLQEREALKRVKRGQNAANVVESSEDRRGIEIYAKQGSPIVAVNDGVIKKIGESERLGRFVTLQDVYGNRYTYGQLGSVARFHPVPKADADSASRSARAVKAHAESEDPKPSGPASAGRQVDEAIKRSAKKVAEDAPRATVPIKERLFAHPDLSLARKEGGLEQLLDRKARKSGRYTIYKNYFSRPFGLDSKDVRLRPLREGSRVIGGTILGRIGAPSEEKASHIDFEIRPAGRGAPRIDPKPILDGWKLLEATAIYRASGKNVLYGDDADGLSVGQIMLLPKTLLEKRVLSDERVEIYPCGRQDIRSGQVDRRVLATLEYLAESGLRPTVTSLKCGHSFYTSAGGVSHHSSGNAVDIAKINGIPILGHQEKGGVTDQAVRRILMLQGTLRPDQLISLLDYGGPSFAMGDHHDHIHVGFRPLFGANKKLGKQAFAVLKPGQWSDLLSRLRRIENPVVPTKPSKYAITVKKKKPRRASSSHRGE